MPNELAAPKKGVLSRIMSGISARVWKNENVDVAQEITMSDAYVFDGGTSITALLGSGRRGARSRAQIYQKWSYMQGDAIISSALTLLVTSALGGHETTGDTVFVEKSPIGLANDKLGAIADEIRDDLAPLFNKIAHTSAYNGVAYGDSYARIYSDRERGVYELMVNEQVHPTLMQPFEKGERTVGFMLYTGQKLIQRLNIAQIARLQMPRTVYIPQPSVIEKSARMAVTEDDPDKLPVLPALVGGSFLFAAEESYDNLYASLLGLVGQRWMDSIDESMVGVSVEGMTSDQQKRFLDSIVKMLQISKKRAEEAVRSGQPLMERIRHIIPVFSDKQVVKMDSGLSGSQNRASISIEDVMLHAKLLSGALGVDLSMLGFSEILSGGLGDGGFFRTSAQVAEKSRLIRTALIEFYNSIIDIHTMQKYGMVFEAKDRPWNINFYGSISAMEAEKQRTKTDAMGAAQMLVQTIQQLKEVGATKELCAVFLAKQMLLDEEEAGMYAAIMDLKSRGQNDGDGGGFGGAGDDAGGGGDDGSV